MEGDVLCCHTQCYQCNCSRPEEFINCQCGFQSVKSCCAAQSHMCCFVNNCASLHGEVPVHVRGLRVGVLPE